MKKRSSLSKEGRGIGGDNNIRKSKYLCTQKANISAFISPNRSKNQGKNRTMFQKDVNRKTPSPT